MKLKKILSISMAIMISASMVGCGKKIVANVNGTEISLSDYTKSLKGYKKVIETNAGTTDIWKREVKDGVTYADQFKQTVLDQLVKDEAVYQEAVKQKLTITDKELNEKFTELKKNIDSNEEHKKQLKEAGMDDAFLKAQLKKDLTIQKYKEKFEKDVKIDDATIKAYYDKHVADLYTIDEVRASHILISTVDKDGKSLSTEKKAEAKKKAEDILDKVKKGEDFAKLAKDNSADTGSAAKGGDLDFFGKGVMVAPFEKAAFSLDKGKVYDTLVESQFGYHIIKVTDKKHEVKTLDQVKAEIKTKLVDDKYMEKVEALSKAAKVEKHEDIAKKVKMD